VRNEALCLSNSSFLVAKMFYSPFNSTKFSLHFAHSPSSGILQQDCCSCFAVSFCFALAFLAKIIVKEFYLSYVTAELNIRLS